MASKGTSPISRQTSQVDSFRVPDHSGVGDFALHCGVREDLFADRATSTVSVWWLSAGRSKPRRVYRNLSDGVVFLKSGHLRSWVPGRALAQAQLLKRRVRQELTETAPERPSVQTRQRCGCAPMPNGARCLKGCVVRGASTIKLAVSGASLRQAISGRSGKRGSTA